MVEIQDENQIPDGRTSHEVRGLKYAIVRVDAGNYESHLTRGAWIEIPKSRVKSREEPSHLTRGAWIEIIRKSQIQNERTVAPHTRCVD